LIETIENGTLNFLFYFFFKTVFGKYFAVNKRRGLVTMEDQYVYSLGWFDFFFFPKPNNPVLLMQIDYRDMKVKYKNEEPLFAV
jgi:hypothetical protein